MASVIDTRQVTIAHFVINSFFGDLSGDVFVSRITPLPGTIVERTGTPLAGAGAILAQAAEEVGLREFQKTLASNEVVRGPVTTNAVPNPDNPRGTYTFFAFVDTYDAAIDPCGDMPKSWDATADYYRALADDLMQHGTLAAVARARAEEGATAQQIADLTAELEAEFAIMMRDAWLPAEYQPVSVQVDESTEAMLIEPAISATYYNCVKLRIGGQWLVTDFFSGKLYHCYVKSKNRAGQGLMSYTFVTLMTLLNRTEPPSLLVAAGDEGANFGIDATPKEALEQVILPHFKKSLPQLEWDEVPQFYIRSWIPETETEPATQSYAIPTVPVVHLVQEAQPKSMREWLESMFGAFQGYTYRMDGWKLQIIAPSWAVETPQSKTLTDTELIGLSVSEDDENIINTQKVTYRPWEFVGDFEDPDTLPDVTDPAYYRVGFNKMIPKPDNRLLLKSAASAPWALDMAAKKDKVLVTWVGYIYLAPTGRLYDQDLTPDMYVDVSDRITKAVHTFEMTDQGYYIAETELGIYITIGTGGARGAFDGALRNELARSDNGPIEGNTVKFRWRLEMKGGGVTATLLYPQPDTIWTFHEDVYSNTLGVITTDVDYQVGAEFHLNVQGVTFQQSRVTYSSTYGVHVPPVGVTQPEGFEHTTDILFGQRPPKLDNYQEDVIIRASYDLFGIRDGPEQIIEVWTLTLPTERDLVGEPVIDWNSDFEADMIAALGGIAETIVKNRINPSKVYLLELAAPFAIAPDDIATRVILPDDGLGDLERITYSEAHAPGSVALSATATVTLTEVADITRYGSSPPGDRTENELPSPPSPTAPDGSDIPPDEIDPDGDGGDGSGAPGDPVEEPDGGYEPPSGGGGYGPFTFTTDFTEPDAASEWVRLWPEYPSPSHPVISIANEGVGGKASLKVRAGQGARLGAKWTRVTDAEDVEILFRWRCAWSGGWNGFETWLMASGDYTGAGAGTGDQRNGVVFNQVSTNRTTTQRLLNGAVVSGGNTSPDYSPVLNSTSWYLSRHRIVDGLNYMKTWADGATEPSSWHYARDPVSPIPNMPPAGAVGFALINFGETSFLWIDQLTLSGIGTSPGEPLPDPGPIAPSDPVVIDVSDIPAPTSPPPDLEKFRYDPAFTPSASLAWWLDRQFASIDRTQRNPDVEGALADPSMYSKRVPKNEVHYLMGQLPGAPDKRITDRLRDILNAMLSHLRSSWTLMPDGSKSAQYAKFENAQNWVHGGGYYHLQYMHPTENIMLYGTDVGPLEERLAHDPIACITAIMGINADQDSTYLDAFKRGAAYLLDHWEPKWEKRIGRDEWNVLKFRHSVTHGVAGEMMTESGLAVIKNLLGLDATKNEQARDRLAFRLVSDLEHATAPNGHDVSVWAHLCRPYASESGKTGGTGAHLLVYLFEQFGSVHMAHEFSIAGFDLTQMQRYSNNISQLMYSLQNENRIKGDCAGSGYFTNGAIVPDTLANSVHPDATLDSQVRRLAGGNVAWADPTTDKQNLKVMLREMERVGYTLERLEAYPSQAVWGFIEMGTLAASKGIDLRDL